MDPAAASLAEPEPAAEQHANGGEADEGRVSGSLPAGFFEVGCVLLPVCTRCWGVQGTVRLPVCWDRWGYWSCMGFDYRPPSVCAAPRHANLQGIIVTLAGKHYVGAARLQQDMLTDGACRLQRQPRSRRKLQCSPPLTLPDRTLQALSLRRGHFPQVCSSAAA